jgi:uncharacterized integral membrane protein (TIGR00698 family)
MQDASLRPPALGGIVVVAALAVAATLLPAMLAALPGPLATLPVSPILVAILLGLGLARVARARGDWAPGLQFASGPLLQLAVMLIGLRLSLGDLGALGLLALPLVMGALVSGLALTWLLGRLLGLGSRLTALLAVGSAVCGASAIAAMAPALRSRPEETAYALACVTLFGLVATILYPWLLGAWVPDPRQVGLVLGAAIHDTAQVTAAALLFEQTFMQTEVLGAATVTKLLRNLAMLVVIPGATWWALRGERAAGGRPALPLFILGFLALAAVRSAGDLVFPGHAAWHAFLDAASMVSAFLFAMAMVAIGMGLRLSSLRALGARPAIVALLTAAGMLAVALTILSLRA